MRHTRTREEQPSDKQPPPRRGPQASSRDRFLAAASGARRRGPTRGKAHARNDGLERPPPGRSTIPGLGAGGRRSDEATTSPKSSSDPQRGRSRGRRSGEGGVPSRIVVENHRRRERSPSPLTFVVVVGGGGGGGGGGDASLLQQGGGAAAAFDDVGPPPSKRRAAVAAIIDPVKREVQEILEKKLMGSNDDCGKIEALRSLIGYFSNEGSHGSKERQRWVIDLQGGCLVLMILRQQLDKYEAAASRSPTSREVVLHALDFLRFWNAHSDSCRSDMSKFDGVGTVVRALEGFADNDPDVARAAMVALVKFAGPRYIVHTRCPARIEVDATGGPAVRRRRELVEEAGALLPAYRALTSRANRHDPGGSRAAHLLLTLLCDDATPESVRALNDAGAVVTFAYLWNQQHQKQMHRQQHPPSPPLPVNEAVVLASCRKWIHKLTS